MPLSLTAASSDGSHRRRRLKTDIELHADFEGGREVVESLVQERREVRATWKECKCCDGGRRVREEGREGGMTEGEGNDGEREVSTVSTNYCLSLPILHISAATGASGSHMRLWYD